MSISMTQYIKITSGVGGARKVRSRELILRIFTPNPLISPDSVLEFGSPDAVGAYFGYTSEEYQRALKYFAYLSPAIVQASKLSFARDQVEPTPPLVLGGSSTWVLAKLKAVAPAPIEGKVDDTTFKTASVDLSTTASLADVAATVQAALRAVADIEIFKACMVTYDATMARFVLTGGTNDAVSVNFTPGDVVSALHFDTGEVIRGVAVALEEPQTVSIADDISNNYGSLLFMRQLELEQIITMATANAAKNIQFMYLVGCTAPLAESYSAALLSVGSVGLTLVASPNTDFDDQIPGTLMAATDYTKRNGVINYMYKQFSDVSPKVNTTEDALKYDALRVNYYGRTQNAGQYIDFYQRGVVMGDSSYPTDMNTHANEQWLKDSCAATLLDLMLAVGRVPANAAGRVQILSALQSPVEMALLNGTISAEKTLNAIQKNYITQLTGDDTAWHQVQNAGYWLDAVMEEFVTEDGRTEWQCVYTLIYSKDDAIRKVTGTHVLI